MSFRYPLQKIVDLKGSQKAMAEWEYAASIGKLRIEEESLAQLYLERKEVEHSLEKTVERPTLLSHILHLQHYIQVLDERITQQSEGVRAAESNVKKCQSLLSDKMIDEKVWLNARDRSVERFKVERLAKEQNELDEIAIVRAANSRR